VFRLKRQFDRSARKCGRRGYIGDKSSVTDCVLSGAHDTVPDTVNSEKLALYPINSALFFVPD
jgi:hypothetical protein